MRKLGRFHIGSSHRGKRFHQEVIVLWAIANDGGWSGAGTYTSINDKYIFPSITAGTDDTTSCDAGTGLNGLTQKWFFGGLHNGPDEFYKIIVAVLGSCKNGDANTQNFYLNGVNKSTAGLPSSKSWVSSTFYGRWKMKDFMSVTPDYTNGPWFSCLPAAGNSKDTYIYNLQLQLFGV